MLRLRYLSNKFQKRTLRPLYAQTQGFPAAAVLDPTLRNSDKSFRKPLSSDTAPTYPLSRSADAFTLKNGLVPGMVLVKSAANAIAVHNGADPTGTAASVNWDDQRDLQAHGLLGNFVGGDLDELGDENNVGVWNGVGSWYEILAPAFDDTGLAAAYSAATAGNPVKLYAGTDGRLKYIASPSNRQVIAYLIERVSASRIVIRLAI